METDAPSVDGAVPEVPESVNHDWVLEAVQVNVPPPALVMPTFCDAGSEPPAVAEKLRLEDPKLNAGAAGFTTNVMPTVWGDPVLGVIVTVSL